ncbi:hypothetical protein [Aquibacillus saliphilus]|nr:hypothetical protein [Aquibacillus saliphilus]
MSSNKRINEELARARRSPIKDLYNEGYIDGLEKAIEIVTQKKTSLPT